MMLGKVIGEVWATVKDPKLEGSRLLVVQPTDPEGRPQGAFVVAVDSLNAGAGDAVLVAQGSSARQTDRTQNRPVDAVIMAIVDRVEVQKIDDLDRDYRDRSKKIDGMLARQKEA
jgi:microcompartment protein CcmK/EutM